MTELISVNLQRYFDNKDKYNERAKEYFNNVYYIKNRDAILEKGRLYRAKQRSENVKIPKKVQLTAGRANKNVFHNKRRYISNNDLIVCFD